MDSHFYVVLQVNDAVAADWSDEEVVRRWGRLFPPRGKDRHPLEVSDAWVEQRLKDTAGVAIARERLNSLGWFMKCVKEPLARLANKQDDCREQGTLEQVIDQPKDRTKHIETQEDESFWLVPLQDCRELDSERAGISPGINLAGYLRLLDWSSRLIRRGKARVPKEVAEILSRLGSSAGLWQQRLEKLTTIERTFGVVFATRAAEISRFAAARGVTKLSNLNGCARRV